MIFSIKELANKVNNYLNKISIQEDDFKYKPLIPIDHADEDGEYSKALLQTLKNDHIKNIAITGPYGSGKSSIIRTFEKNHGDKEGLKFLNITLAAFNLDRDPKAGDENESSATPKDNVATKSAAEDKYASIEKSLLQQIIYKVEGTSLPDSHFNRVILTRWYSKFGVSLLVVTWLLAIYYFINPEFKFYSGVIYFEDTFSPYLKLITVFSTIALVQLALNLIPKSSLSKIGVATAEISFNERNGDSILNKHLDEIIYFFSKADFNVVVFEDLDRFYDKEIFVKLREINTLLNNSNQIRSLNKSIKFVYALGDSAFESLERTKFFDFIIPVIPVVNSFNSSEMLKKEINLAFPDNTIPSGFYNDVTLYLDDMRLLLNITNEFVIYKKKLSSISKVQLRDTKLLSLIIYKNKCPKDFSSLNFGKGEVASIFKRKAEFQLQLIDEIETNIQILNEQLKNADEEICKNLDELRAIYVSKIYEINPNKSHFNINGHGFDSLLKEDAFNQLRATTGSVMEQSYRTVLAKNFSEIEVMVDPNFSFAERESFISNKGRDKKQSIQLKIDELSKKIDLIKNQKLEQLIKNNPKFNLMQVNDKKQDVDYGLLKFLITDGYIDEDYESYISFFYEGELTSDDKQFLMSVTSHEPLKFEFKLTNIEKILERLVNNPQRLSTRAVLNLDLFEYLIGKYYDRHIIKLAFMTIGSSEDDGAYFTYDYLTTRKYLSLFILNTCQHVEEGFWEKAIKLITDLNERNSKKLVKILLEHATASELDKINKKGFLTNYLSEEPTRIEILEVLNGSLSKELIVNFNLKFLDLNQFVNKDLLEFVYENNAYEINRRNIDALLNDEINVTDNKLIGNFSSIVESSKSKLISYVNKNINEYANAVLLRFGLENEESESAMIQLLNHEDLLDQNAVQIIENFKFTLSKITDIDNEAYWSLIVKNSRVKANWDNVLVYFKLNKDQLDESLIDFLNTKENYEHLSIVRMSSKTDKVNAISEQIVYSNRLSNEAYIYLLSSIPFWYEDLSGLVTSKEKLNALLLKNKVELSTSNYDFIKKNLSDLGAALLIEKNITEFLKGSIILDIGLNEYKRLLESKTLNKIQKIDLIKSIKAVKFTENHALAKLVYEFIVKNSIKNIFENEEFEAILSCDIGMSNKINLFMRYSAVLEDEKIIDLISIMGEPIVGLVEGRKPKIPTTKESLIFARYLEQKGLVSFKDQGGEIRFNPKGKVKLVK